LKGRANIFFASVLDPALTDYRTKNELKVGKLGELHLSLDIKQREKVGRPKKITETHLVPFRRRRQREKKGTVDSGGEENQNSRK
jgi:hypothetical protein